MENRRAQPHLLLAARFVDRLLLNARLVNKDFNCLASRPAGQKLVRENILQANEGNMIDREERRLHDRQVDPVGDQDDYVQRDQIDVDSNNFQSSDDSASTGSADICFAFPVVCLEDAKIHGQHMFQKIINPPFIAVNTQCGGESEEPLKILPDIELEDPFGCVQ